MQDKETVDDAEEALTCKADIASDRRGSSFENTDSPPPAEKEKKESTKDGKFAFRRMKQPKKGKCPHNTIFVCSQKKKALWLLMTLIVNKILLKITRNSERYSTCFERKKIFFFFQVPNMYYLAEAQTPDS